jgi:hypothetical protein
MECQLFSPDFNEKSRVNPRMGRGGEDLIDDPVPGIGLI